MSMIKASKTWKIEKYGHVSFSGRRISSIPNIFPEHTQLLYDTELDCLLDIVTEPSNHGLKVYRHQYIPTTNNTGDAIKYIAIRKLPIITESDRHFIHLTEEEVEDLPVNSFEFGHPVLSTIISQPFTIHYWVEAFLQ